MFIRLRNTMGRSFARSVMGSAENPFPGTIRVLVTDACRILCELMTDALQRCPYRFNALAHAGDASIFPAILAKHKPHVAVIGVDVEGARVAGFELMDELRTRCPHVPVVTLIDCRDRDLVIESFRGGAKGVFSRNESFIDLCKCILCVHRGQIWAKSIELQYVLEDLAKSAPRRFIDAKGDLLLTKREQEVANLVARGLTNREISQRLTLTEHTVKNYVSHIFEKLGISTRVELALYAVNR